MPRFYASRRTLEQLDVASSDLEPPADATASAWPLRPDAAAGLWALLEREGVDRRRTVLVRRASHGLGLLFSQDER